MGRVVEPTMNHPLVSVGITAYNASESIQRAVYSALGQTWRPLEIVIVDDYSSDHTVDVLQKLSKKHCEIRFFTSESNGGVALARNRIIKEATGEFLVFFDDDDESVPERIEQQVKRIEEYEKEFSPTTPVICHSPRRISYLDGNEMIHKALGLDAGGPAPSGTAVAKRIVLGAPLKNAYGSCPTCSQMARLKTYIDLNGFDDAFRRSEDTDFSVRLARSGGHFVSTAQPLVLQQMTLTSEKSLVDELKYTLMLIEKHKELADSHSHYFFSINWIKAKYLWLGREKGPFLFAIIRLFLNHPLRVVMRFALGLRTLKINHAFSSFHGKGSV
jgi:glycosyltransferase involved in cell wall biosynthesis